MRILIFLVAVFLNQLCVTDLALAAGGVPQAVWQDSDRNHRRSPTQIVNQLKTPQVRAGDNLPLAPDAQDTRAAKARKLIASQDGSAQARDSL